MFYYTSCQVGAEQVLKTEIGRLCPSLRPAFSRPGFVTFKDVNPQEEWSKTVELNTIPSHADQLDSTRLSVDPIDATGSNAAPTDVNRLNVTRLNEIRRQSLFARTIGIALGSIREEVLDRVAAEFWKIVCDSALLSTGMKQTIFLHCFSRDVRLVGDKGFEPFLTQEDQMLFQRLIEHPHVPPQLQISPSYASPAHPGSLVLDCVKIDPSVYWVGLHQADDEHGRFAGGVLLREQPVDMVSRAWLKFEEAIRWSNFPVKCGSRCLDIGSSPGGATQALLTRGAWVLGVDPGKMDSRVLAFPNFTHLRGRIGQIKRRLFRPCQLAIADMNVAPSFTLDVLEELAQNPNIPLQGLLLTLKLFEWKLVEEIPTFLDRIRSWGFKQIQARQLTFNRQEITVSATR
ncbi:MAG: SAM-dependent methyltransferase [Thermoguttaceae bacterium]